MGEDLIWRGGGEQAKVRAAGHRAGRVRGDLPPGLVQVDLAGAELQGTPPVSEDDGPHPEHPFVEAAGQVHVGDRQDKMVQAGDGDCRCRCRCR